MHNEVLNRMTEKRYGDPNPLSTVIYDCDNPWFFTLRGS